LSAPTASVVGYGAGGFTGLHKKIASPYSHFPCSQSIALFRQLPSVPAWLAAVHVFFFGGSAAGLAIDEISAAHKFNKKSNSPALRATRKSNHGHE
jgi:hypothetical protein